MQLCSKTWKELEFKPYNFQALGAFPTSGSSHPLLKVLILQNYDLQISKVSRLLLTLQALA